MADWKVTYVASSLAAVMVLRSVDLKDQVSAALLVASMVLLMALRRVVLMVEMPVGRKETWKVGY